MCLSGESAENDYFAAFYVFLPFPRMWKRAKKSRHNTFFPELFVFG
jgi:hypothetical protein